MAPRLNPAKTAILTAILAAAGLVTLMASVARADSPGPTPQQRAEAARAYLAGAKALDRNDLNAAEQDFARAAALDSTNRDYTLSVEIARQHRATQLIQEADKARLLGQQDAWRQKLATAALLDPKHPMLAQHMNELAANAVEDDREDRVSLEDAAPPVQLTPRPGRHSFHQHTDARQLIRQVLDKYGIQPSFDASVQSQTVRLDADDVDYAQAAEMLRLVTNTFIVPLDPVRVLVARDDKENRARYERQVMETVYLPGLTATEMNDMGNIVRNVFEAQQATINPDQHTVTVRAPQSRLRALNSELKEMLDGRSQVQMDVRLYEIDRSRLTNIGVQLPQSTTVFNVPSELNSIIKQNQALVQQIIASGLAAPGDYAAIAALLVASGQVSSSILNQPFALFGGGLTLSGLTLGAARVNLALNQSDTRAIDNVTLRVLDQEEATIRSGERYPIITSTYSSLTPTSLSIPGISSAGLSSTLAGLGINASALQSSANQIIPQVQYQDLGLTLKATPRIQRDQDVTLKIDFKLDSLTGRSLNGNPVLASRAYQGIISLHPGDSALVISSLSKQQSRAISGIPGLSELPGFQSTTNRESTVDTTNLIMLITPHIVRISHLHPAGQLVMLPQHQ